MFGQHRGDRRLKVRGVVEIFDVGAVHTKDVVDSNCREVVDNVVVPPGVSWACQ
nr:hypothetical protein [Mycobacterium basiliense]